ncbi:MAG: GspE/PulE family protein [Vulcanimicrobiaceae bacterium]
MHLEPTLTGGRVRARVDGTLRELREVPSALFAQMVSRIKLLSGMDIADKRQPQDGHYQVDHERGAIDARVSSMPTVLGEKLVVRLLDLQARIPRLGDLGLPQPLFERYRELVHAPNGLIVVCGPTGSGKTTTLYASLSDRSVQTEHLCSIEDPVEARIGGVVQVQVNARAGLTFALALRSFLRQDPDVIMVGEMRDQETAAVAMAAALSGQLVMTSLHSSDAPRTIERLLELGVSRHALAAGLAGILAQRLVRRLCDGCKVERPLRPGESSALGLPPGLRIYDPVGCSQCASSGYRGRVGVFEGFPVTSEMRLRIATGGSSVNIRQLAIEDGFSSMRAQAIEHVAAGATSIGEVRRILAS